MLEGLIIGICSGLLVGCCAGMFIANACNVAAQDDKFWEQVKEEMEMK